MSMKTNITQEDSMGTEILMTEEKPIETLPEMVEKNPQPNPLQTFQPTSIEELKAHVKAVDDAKREVMEPGRDYMVIPGTKKPSLLKPGGEKLLKLYNLGARFEILEEVQDHDREWEYRTTEWFERKKLTVKKPAYGFYFYKVRCELFHVPTGTMVGDGIATCSSNERPNQPANTIIKMAQKSAMLGAVLINCNASDLFTQDLEDLSQQGSSQGHSQGSGGVKQASDKQVGFIRKLIKDRGLDEGETKNITDQLDSGITMSQAKTMIDNLLARKENTDPEKQSHVDEKDFGGDLPFE